MIVVDLGCSQYHRHPSDTSVARLVERFKLGAGDTLYGIDPMPHGVPVDPAWQCDVQFIEAAAWTFDGWIDFEHDPRYELRGHVARLSPAGHFTPVADPKVMRSVPCLDFARWLNMLPEPAIVKMDIEGAEHVLLRHLLATGTIHLVRALYVEVHGNEPLPDLPIAWDTWA